MSNQTTNQSFLPIPSNVELAIVSLLNQDNWELRWANLPEREQRYAEAWEMLPRPEITESQQDLLDRAKAMADKNGWWWPEILAHVAEGLEFPQDRLFDMLIKRHADHLAAMAKSDELAKINYQAESLGRELKAAKELAAQQELAAQEQARQDKIAAEYAERCAIREQWISEGVALVSPHVSWSAKATKKVIAARKNAIAMATGIRRDEIIDEIYSKIITSDVDQSLDS